MKKTNAGSSSGQTQVRRKKASPQVRQNSIASSRTRQSDNRSSRNSRDARTPSQSRRTGRSSVGNSRNHTSSPADQKRRRSASAQQAVRRSAKGKQRKRTLLEQLPRPAAVLILLLCAGLFLFGIWRLLGGGKDTVPPVITLDHEEGYVIMPWQEYKEEGFSASDNRDGDLTEQVQRMVMEDRICYKVADKAGNLTVSYRDIPYDTGYREASGKDFPDIDIDDPDADGKIVYLTFDDGPGEYTEQLLDTLDRYGVQVTFFVTGSFPTYQDMIKKEDAAGHSIGIHSLTHDFAKIYSSDKAFWKDIDRMQEIIKKQTGHTTNIMRFAGGTSNSISANYTPGIMTLLTKQAKQKGFQYFDWNISSGDGGSGGDMDMVVTSIIQELPHQDPCVVLCHDTKEYTVKAMEYIIPWLLDHGYELRPLQFDSEPVQHGVQN